MLEKCFTFRKIIDTKHKTGKKIFQEGADINNLPFPKHNDRCKAQAIMVSHSMMKIERCDQTTFGGEPDLDQMAQQVQNLLKFKSFYDHMDFDASQCIAITKVTNKFINSSGGSDFVQRALCGLGRFQDLTSFSLRRIGRFCLVSITCLFMS